MAFALLLPLCTHSGDLSKVQWPNGLQGLKLYNTGVSGASLMPPRGLHAHMEFSLRAAPAANILLPHSDPVVAFALLHLSARIQGTCRRSSGPHRYRSSTCRAACRSPVRFCLICAPNENHRTTSLVRPQPQTSFFLILTPRWRVLFYWLFARIQGTCRRSSGLRGCRTCT